MARSRPGGDKRQRKRNLMQLVRDLLVFTRKLDSFIYEFEVPAPGYKPTRKTLESVLAIRAKAMSQLELIGRTTFATRGGSDKLSGSIRTAIQEGEDLRRGIQFLGWLLDDVTAAYNVAGRDASGILRRFAPQPKEASPQESENLDLRSQTMNVILGALDLEPEEPALLRL